VSALMGVSNFKTMWLGSSLPAHACMHTYKLCCTHVHAIHTVTQLIILDLKMQHSCQCITAKVGKVRVCSACCCADNSIATAMPGVSIRHRHKITLLPLLDNLFHVFVPYNSSCWYLTIQDLWSKSCSDKTTCMCKCI